MILLCLTPETGTISRYSVYGRSLSRTHRASIDTKYEFTPAEVELMRVNPPSEFAHTVELRG